MKKVINIVLLFSIIIILALSGCEKKSTGSTEPENNSPTISSFTVSPGTVAANGLASIQVSATDEDGDQLTYDFNPDAGEIVGTTSSPVWVAPDTEGTYSISVTVSDGQGGEVTSTGSLTVTQAVTQITGIVKLPPNINEDLNGSQVFLYEFPDKSFWFNNQTSKIITITGSGRKVVFNMTGVTPGYYILDVWKDVDNNGGWSTGDYIGVYGHINLDPIDWNYLKEAHFNPTGIQIADGETMMVDVSMVIAPER